MFNSNVASQHSFSANSTNDYKVSRSIDEFEITLRFENTDRKTWNRQDCQPAPGIEPTDPEIVVGFDSEWVNAARAEMDDATGEDNIIMSYQFAVLNTGTGAEATFLYPTRGASKSHRFNFGPMLGEALRGAMNDGVIDATPHGVTVVGHFLRADLGAVRDWPDLKSKVDSLRGTVCTLGRSMKFPVRHSKRGHQHTDVTVNFADTMLLAAQGSSLKTLGDTIGVKKVELAPGVIKRMDLLLRDDPALFERYAKQDAIVAARYYAQVRQTLATKLGVKKRVPTLGAAAIAMIFSVIEGLGLSPDCYFGYERDRKGKRHILTSLTTIWTFAANCYHGGRNEAYWVGLTPLATPLFDVDLKSAYTTALALAGVPDWDSAAPEKNIERLAVIDDAMTLARVRFRFPEDTRFPSLPVRGGDRGLIYPLQGVSWCTGAEIVVALSQGARIVVEEGWRVEWIEGSPRPFEKFTGLINTTRKAAKESGDLLLDQTAKEIGNSAYGKLAQAVDGVRTVQDGGVNASRGKRKFDARTGTMRTMSSSQITNPMLAAYVTGLVRAALSEALASLPDDAIVATATTDGFLSSIPVERIDERGPVASAFARARKAISGDPAIWETKHVIGRALVMKTRGTITVEGIDGNKGEPVLARAGYKFEDRPTDRWEECARWTKTYAERNATTRSLRNSLTPLRQQWLAERDLVEVTTAVRLNLDFDMKRQIVDPTDCDGLLCAETRPWPTLADFEKARDGLEDWKKAQRRVLKTSTDLRDLGVWTANRKGLKASGSTAQSGRPPLVNAFMRAIARKLLDINWPQKHLAEFLTKNGFPTGIDTVKKATRRGDLKLRALTNLSAEEVAFAAAVYRANRDIPLESLVAAGSPAAEALEKAKT